eukprot:Lithocolla_globosa_v1_NODE_2113_length_2161_cov_12.910256.p1 type:complete len:306 gc:universal NODE_2113_length_2161_cov_12.910256:1755-838(-)
MVGWKDKVWFEIVSSLCLTFLVYRCVDDDNLSYVVTAVHFCVTGAVFLLVGGFLASLTGRGNRARVEILQQEVWERRWIAYYTVSAVCVCLVIFVSAPGCPNCVLEKREYHTWAKGGVVELEPHSPSRCYLPKVIIPESFMWNQTKIVGLTHNKEVFIFYECFFGWRKYRIAYNIDTELDEVQVVMESNFAEMDEELFKVENELNATLDVQRDLQAKLKNIHVTLQTHIIHTKEQIDKLQKNTEQRLKSQRDYLQYLENKVRQLEEMPPPDSSAMLMAAGSLLANLFMFCYICVKDRAQPTTDIP